MDPEVIARVKEGGDVLFSMGLRMTTDVGTGKADYELLLAMVNRAGRAVAMLREALEKVPESQR